MFSSKSFLACLGSPPRFPIFPIANFLWKAKVPHKVMASIWTMALGKIMLMICFISKDKDWLFHQDMCVLCCANSEISSYIFLHCDFERHLGSKLFGLIREDWAAPLTVLDFL